MREMSEAALHETIGLIYDCAIDPSVWPTALESMCRHVDACQGSISVLDTTRREIRFATEWTSSPDWPKWRKLLDEKYAALMPFFGLMQQFEIGEVRNTAQMAEMIGLQNVYEHPFFKEWALPSGRKDTIGSIVMKKSDRVGIFAMHTPTSRDLVGPRELAIGALLVPHVRRAVTIGDLLDQATSKAQTLQATLDTVSAAVVVTDADARVVHCNAAGDALLRSGALIDTEDGQLRTRQLPATRALRTAIVQSEDPVNKLGANGIDVPLRSRSGGPAIAHVLPLQQGRRQRDWGTRATAAVFVSPVQYSLPSAAALTALYGLTAMEARVLMQIAEGRNRAEAAATLGIADSTVKSHLERVFSKTGANDQAALARLLRDLSAPIRKAD